MTEWTRKHRFKWPFLFKTSWKHENQHSSWDISDVHAFYLQGFFCAEVHLKMASPTCSLQEQSILSAPDSTISFCHMPLIKQVNTGLYIIKGCSLMQLAVFQHCEMTKSISEKGTWKQYAYIAFLYCIYTGEKSWRDLLNYTQRCIPGFATDVVKNVRNTLTDCISDYSTVINKLKNKWNCSESTGGNAE